MFATPGWSVSASNLKAQTPTNKRPKPDDAGADKNPKKRKRNDKKVDDQKRPKWDPSSGERRPKHLRYKRQDFVREHKKPKWVTDAAQESRREDGVAGEEFAIDVEEPRTAEGESSGPPPAMDGLTPLQQSMRQKLISARFRHLNQALYTGASAHAMSMFIASPNLFQDYHLGFRQQVAQWPQNPVDGFVERIKRRGKISSKKEGKKRKEQKEKQSSSASAAVERSELNLSPLPRTKDTCTIADLGCGEAKLSSTLQKHCPKLKLDIISYDLSISNPLVQLADVAKLPRAEATVDVAIFCLALMGTNWPKFIEEAYRVLRWRGELWIAEIKSRFGRVRERNQLGSVKAKPKRQILGAAGGEEVEDPNQLLEADDTKEGEDQTDLSAFKQVLSRRGFVMDEASTDRSNKMFVSMVFVKAATPVEELQKEADGQPKFIEKRSRIQLKDEAQVLKPCLYKTR